LDTLIPSFEDTKSGYHISQHSGANEHEDRKDKKIHSEEEEVVPSAVDRRISRRRREEKTGDKGASAHGEWKRKCGRNMNPVTMDHRNRV